MLSCGGTFVACLQNCQQCVQEWRWSTFWHLWRWGGHLRRDERGWHLLGYSKLLSASPVRGEQWLTSPPAASLNVDKSASTVLLELFGCHFSDIHKSQSGNLLSVEAITASGSHPLRYTQGFVYVSLAPYIIELQQLWGTASFHKRTEKECFLADVFTSVT